MSSLDPNSHKRERIAEEIGRILKKTPLAFGALNKDILKTPEYLFREYFDSCFHIKLGLDYFLHLDRTAYYFIKIKEIPLNERITAFWNYYEYHYDPLIGKRREVMSEIMDENIEKLFKD